MVLKVPWERRAAEGLQVSKEHGVAVGPLGLREMKDLED